MDGRRLSIKLGGFIKTFLRERSVDGGRISTKFGGFYEKIHEMSLDGGCDFHDVQEIFFCKMVGLLVDNLCRPRAIQHLRFFFADVDVLPGLKCHQVSVIKDFLIYLIQKYSKRRRRKIS